jgi:hypothetical protein
VEHKSCFVLLTACPALDLFINCLVFIHFLYCFSIHYIYWYIMCVCVCVCLMVCGLGVCVCVCVFMTQEKEQLFACFEIWLKMIKKLHDTHPNKCMNASTHTLTGLCVFVELD